MKIVAELPHPRRELRCVGDEVASRVAPEIRPAVIH
eukprot:COSAG05_NODE_9533_length_618_cov_0.639692_2_plen_35_part_01